MNKKTQKTLKWLLSAFAAIITLICAVYIFHYASNRYYRSGYPVQYREEVAAYCEQYGVQQSLAFAVIRTESSFKPDAVSGVGARGLMQLTEDTFDWVKSRLEPTADTVYDDMFNPQINIKYGIYLLSVLKAEFGSTGNALCAYHAGWGNAKNWLANTEYSADGEIHTIPFADTRGYVAKVIETAKIYERLYAQGT